MFFAIIGVNYVNPNIAHAANDPFTCTPAFYQIINNQLKILNPITGVYSDIGPPAPDYNSMGYNIEDNYIYGVTRISNIGHVLRIGNDGSTVDLGIPVGVAANNYLAGDFDNLGNLYVSNGGNTIYKIDVSAMTITPVVLTGPPIGGADLVFINNKLYSLANQTLYIVDLSNNTSSTITVPGLPVSAAYGAGWTDQTNALYFGLNVTGEIWQINDYTTASPTGTLKLTAQVAIANDGASCPTAQSTFDPPIATNDSYTSTYNTPINVTSNTPLSNDTGNSLTVTSHTNPSHGVLGINTNGSFTYTPNSGYYGNDSFTYTVTDGFGRTASATVSINIQTPSLLAETGSSSWAVSLLSIAIVFVSVYIFRRKNRLYRSYL